VDKICHVNFDVVSGNVVARVDFGGTVRNTSGVQLTGLQVTDTPAANSAISISRTTLFPLGHKDASGNPDDTATYSGFYRPSSLPTGTTLGRYFFSDSIHATAASALGGTVTPQDAPASCPVCGNGQCSVSRP
jgi:hypothetical protein